MEVVYTKDFRFLIPSNLVGTSTTVDATKKIGVDATKNLEFVSPTN